ncbi:MAG: hypothetical protein AAF125_26475 [Chloroflexota bacterium]
MIHVVAGVMMALFIYSPLGDSTVYTILMQFGVVPLVTLTGLFMWQQARVMKWMRGSTRANG